jgi:RNA polymerase sigma factor (sigma-70 family)
MDTDLTGPPPAADSHAPHPGGQVAGQEPASGIELLYFAQTLGACSSHAELERRFIAGFGRLFDLPMYGLYTVDPWTGLYNCVASTGVSDAFLARYEREGREVDTMQAHRDATGRAAYNMSLVESMDEWLESPLYTKVKYLHDVRHEIQAPVVTRDGVIGTVHCGTNDPGRGFTPYEVRLTEALARVTGTVLEGIHSKANLERERDQAVVALDRTGTAVVITDPADPEPRINAAARRLLADVVGAERGLHRVIARPGTDRDFSRHVDVELVGGGTGILRGHSSHTRAEAGALITVLELQRDQSEISEETLAALTPREREVARLVIDGLSDREIADRLNLSHHTVSQHAKRIYRKLDVDSRVALTRLLLTLPSSSRRS